MDLREFNDNTPYTIMFGPDKCGSESKLHFIFRHVNPKNQTIEEKHCKKLDTKERAQLEEGFKDKRPHLYRLVIKPDNSYEISVDYKFVNFGTLVEHFEPPVNPPAEIDDPNDNKPEDWDEREKIPDPGAEKPDDWDESQPRQSVDELAVMPDGWLEDEPDMIPDEDAEKPEDWDEEMDGEWEAPLVNNPLCSNAPGCGKWKRPLVDNPHYKGKWFPPLINNPNYKGKWKARKISNPDYYHDAHPFRMTPIGGIGIELWSMSDELYFDNLIIADSIEIADAWAKETFDLKVQKLDVNDAGLFKRILTYSNRNPWLYAVYVVVVGLPLVLIVTFCCSGSSKVDPNEDDDEETDPKKTDAVQEDDAEEEEESGGEAEEETLDEPAASESEKTSSSRRRKARKE
jgi:calnexin